MAKWHFLKIISRHKLQYLFLHILYTLMAVEGLVLYNEKSIVLLKFLF